MRNRFSLFTLVLLALSLSLTLPVTAQTYKFSTIYGFKDNSSDPKTPSALIMDGSGNLYGTSISGGSFNNGAVFKLSLTVGFSLLYSFNGNDSTDAVSPINLALDAKGNLYGDTQYVARSFVGDLFKLTPGGNGSYTFTSLYVAPDAPVQMVVNRGAIFWLNCGYDGNPTCDNNTSLNELSSGQNSVLYSFASTGFYATGNYVMDKYGNIYGTQGGDGGQTSWGLVYRWSPVSGYAVLHTFNGTDGSDPSGLRQDSSGNLYGTTIVGGTTGFGTVFKISSSGVFSTLYNFCSKTSCTDGSYPLGPLVLDSKGNIFGVLNSGVFKLTAGGGEGLLYNSGAVFMGPGLVMDLAGNLYGTTLTGGSGGLGSVYKLTASK
ncbi:MAG TPA: choice-of-anchor tandem repeat GloVer-containing protein [Candidatus Sulfotelmatobacter sp.]|nr:choice-of-anchor tandem repeat GloVer-containing protein [Candidatus Sulfotelmatobacter sp.]